MLNKLLVAALLLTLTACAGKDLEMTDSAEVDYEKAVSLMSNYDYSRANIYLGEFSAKHPYSRYAIKAEIMRIYAAYMNSEFVLSETLAEGFISRHPDHADIAYVRYLYGMSLFKQVSKPERDQAFSQKAIDAFEEVIVRHPNSRYARDVRPKVQALRAYMAKHELLIGEHYFDREMYVAAANRFKVVLDKYQDTPSIEEALYYLAASYAALNIKDSARETAMLLRYNFPEGEWSEKASSFL